jgi:allantoinase
VLVDDRLGPASLHVRGGAIAAIAGPDDTVPGCQLVEAGDSVVMAGLIDTHVHVNEPGRTEWEGYRSATRAAAAGGVTALCDMPLNSVPPTTTGRGLAEKIAAARDQCWIDVGFWGGVVPGNAGELAAMAAGGARGFKCFLAPSGVDEFRHVGPDDLRASIDALRALGLPLLVHAELPEPIARAEAGWDVAGAAAHRRYADYLASRPRVAEDLAVAFLLGLTRDTGVGVHVVHHSSADSLAALAAARADGLPITAETCPHYLHFAAEAIADGATQFKCAPPIREGENRERLWDALGAGVLDMVVSDHSPCPPALKQTGAGSFRAAWGGIASLQLGLPVMWTEARRRGVAVATLARWMSAAPARLAGWPHKGSLAVGRDADVVVWDPDAAFRVDAETLFHRHPVTPYAGETLYGLVEMTFVRGQRVYDRGTLAERPLGRVLT